MQEAQIEQAKAKKIGEKHTSTFTGSKTCPCPRRLVFLTLCRVPFASPESWEHMNDVTLEIHTAITLAFHNIWIEICKVHGERKKNPYRMAPPSGLRAVAITCSPSLYKTEILVIPVHRRALRKGLAPLRGNPGKATPCARVRRHETL
jgi:hypothetical protein